MGLIAFESCPPNSLKSQFILADTSFVLATQFDPRFSLFHSSAIKFLKDHQPANYFGINFTAKQETLRKLRQILIEDKIKQMNPALFAKVKGQATGERIKTLIKKAENLVVEALSNSLKPLMVAIEGNFEYYQSTPNGKLNWEDAIEIMEQYLLDSSDATILNFAIKMGFDGLATCDGDFKRVDNVQGFTIYMPKALLSTK